MTQLSFKAGLKEGVNKYHKAVHSEMKQLHFRDSKLVHQMKYIRGTRNLSLILSANDIGTLKWWIYGSFVVHPNMRGQNVGGL